MLGLELDEQESDSGRARGGRYWHELRRIGRGSAALIVGTRNSGSRSGIKNTATFLGLPSLPRRTVAGTGIRHSPPLNLLLGQLSLEPGASRIVPPKFRNPSAPVSLFPTLPPPPCVTRKDVARTAPSALRVNADPVVRFSPTGTISVGVEKMSLFI
jgi:hypothetical protein